MFNKEFIAISGLETLYQRLLRLPKEAGDAAVEEANKYILTQMQIYPPKPTAPFVWSSEKQRRYVMMKISKGDYVGRTQALRKSWKTEGQGQNQIVTSNSSYAEFVQDRNQIVGHQKNGWITVNEMLKTKGGEILKKFEAGVKKAIKKLGL